MNRQENSKKMTIIMLIAFAVISLFISSFLLFHNGINGVDAFYYWVNSAYSARGYTLEWVKENGFIIDSIGNMQGIGVLPYGRLLNNLILPGFMPYNVAYAYNLVLIVIITFLLGKNIYEWIDEKGFFNDKLKALVATVCFLMIPWLWPGYLRAGNIGGLIGLMAILAAFYVDKHNNIAAMFVAFSLIKPQIGGAFLIVLLLTKKYKIVFKTALFIAISEMIHMIYTMIMNSVRGIYWPLSLGSIISIFEGYAGKNAEAERGETWYLYYGIFNLFKELGVPVLIVLFLSMLSGIFFIIFLVNYIKRRKDMSEDYIVTFSIAALASLFWFYKSECDNIVVILCNLIILYYLQNNNDRKRYAITSIFLIGVNWLVGRYLLRFPFEIVSYPVGILIDQILQMGLFTLMIILCVRNNMGCVFKDEEGI